MTDRKAPPRDGIDWEHRRKVILKVQKAGGTAKDAGQLLGLKEDTVLKTSRRLGIRFPSRNGYHGRTKAAPASPTNAGTVAVRKQNKSAWTAYHQRRRFAKAMEDAPEQQLSDAELIERAIAEGKVTKLPPGFGLLSTIQFVTPRAGASKGART